MSSSKWFPIPLVNYAFNLGNYAKDGTFQPVSTGARSWQDVLFDTEGGGGYQYDATGVFEESPSNSLHRNATNSPLLTVPIARSSMAGIAFKDHSYQSLDAFEPFTPDLWLVVILCTTVVGFTIVALDAMESLRNPPMVRGRGPGRCSRKLYTTPLRVSSEERTMNCRPGHPASSAS